MPALQFILTTAGKNAIVAANNTGTNPVVIDRVAIGSASWTPTAAATALQTEIKKISAVGGGVVADDTIHVTAQDSSADVYTVKEVGLYTAGNVLLAVYSQSAAIITKGAGTVALIAADLVITGIPAGSVTVGDTTFDYPQASETTKGVAEIATTAEAQAGTDNERIITPAKLQTVTATETRKGVIELATVAEVQTGTDTTRAVTPAGLAARTATETRAGVIELATDAEVEAGTDTTRAVTPATLLSRTATTTRSGVIEIATFTEVQAGTDLDRAITPAGLQSCTATTTRAGVIEVATSTEVDAGADTSRAVVPNTLRQFDGCAKAWVNFNGIGTPAIRDSYNVSSITDFGTGRFGINFDTAIGRTTYAAVANYNAADSNVAGTNDGQASCHSHASASVQVVAVAGSGTLQDPAKCSVVIF